MRDCHNTLKGFPSDFVTPTAEKQRVFSSLPPGIAAHVNWSHVWEVVSQQSARHEQRALMLSLLLHLLGVWKISQKQKLLMLGGRTDKVQEEVKLQIEDERHSLTAYI